jgi:hypothetical protein
MVEIFRGDIFLVYLKFYLRAFLINKLEALFAQFFPQTLLLVIGVDAEMVNENPAAVPGHPTGAYNPFFSGNLEDNQLSPLFIAIQDHISGIVPFRACHIV